MKRDASPLRLLPRGRLDEPYRGPRRRCDLCGAFGKELRRVNYAFRPWGQLHRPFAARSVIHTWHAVVPDEPLYREIPSTWGKSPEEFQRLLEELRERRKKDAGPVHNRAS